MITFLCQIILDDELEIFRIHAGINVEKIQDKMLYLIDRAKECEDKQKRLWVFFDEFNTTRSIGIIKEITCERTLFGKSLPKNMVFLGACNPRRYKPDQAVFDNNIGIRKDRYHVQQLQAAMGGERLLYTVVPLPETMLEYVWDYGFLDRDTEKKYIATMLKICVHLSEQAPWFKVLVPLISESQAFIREREDVSSVSLRDVVRFCRLFDWFHASIIKRDSNSSSVATMRRAAITSLLLCYYFRLKSLTHKQEYIDMIEKTFITMFPEEQIKQPFVTDWLNVEQMDIINRMELPSGTAKNRALLENIFVLLACIINRIPLVICGKPGCSKTSAVQIVISNLKGKKSRDSFFQTLPELIAVSYQGSQNCTSESIEKVFERANKYLTAQSNSSLLPVIVFDEIGLAELSPHNPLKVLHAELEVETCKYGFVGISNWRLDASKMNRTLYLACSDPDGEDLELTGNVIAKGILEESEAARRLKDILPGLSIAYYKLFSSLKLEQKYEYYFGLRDFYSLIKGVVREIQHNPHIDPYTTIRRQLTINFDGIVDGASFMWNNLCRILKREELRLQYEPPNLKQILDQNLNKHSSSGRYLMLIAENESAIDYVERYIHVMSCRGTQNIRTLVGSQMPGDLVSTYTYTEAYSYRVLMDIILYAEKNVTLVMRQLGHLYDNLYDLFNQNFAVSAQKKYCRIALGALYHPRCFVNDNFYCIVFVNEQDVAKCDPPFLNRFEKHCITIQDLMNPLHWQISNRLHSWLADFLPEKQNEHFPLLQHLFVGYNVHHVCSLVIDTCEKQKSQQQEIDEETIMNLCKEKLLRVSSFDLVLTLALTLNNKDDNEQLIQQYYNIHARTTFADVIARNAPKQIIYTYTQIYDNICYDNKTTDEIKLSNFKMELELVNKIKTFYQTNNSKRLLLIRIDYRTEYKQLLSIKHILINAFNEYTEVNERYVWLIIHLQRNTLHEATNDVLFDNWSIDMINDLNNLQLLPIETVMNPSYKVLSNDQRFDISESLFIEMIERCLSKFHYTIINKQAESKINQRRNSIIDYLINTDIEFNLRRIMKEKLAILMKTMHHDDRSGRYLDWRQDLISDARTIATCRSFNDAFQTTLTNYYDTYCLLLFAHLELHGFIESYLFFMKEKNHSIEQLWLECFNLTFETMDRTILNVDRVDIQLILDLRLPCAAVESAALKQISKTIQQTQDSDDENDNFILIQLQDKSFYKTHFDHLILNDVDLFQHYLHDQFLILIVEHNIHLSIDFVLQLITSNPNRNNLSRLKHLLINYEELLQLLNIFEKGCQLVGEQTVLHVCTEQFIITDDNAIKANELYYTLVLKRDSYFLLPPGNMNIDEKFQFECSGDPFIENSMMNLIELILSPQTIATISSIEFLSTTCSLICRDILSLTNYSVDNLEKLRSFMSLIRCITSLNQDRSLTILKQICTPSLEPMFESCQSIHQFIQRLLEYLEVGQITTDKETIQRTVIKLEVEFLKNWLLNNSEKYDEVLQLISKNDNHLWQYSSKILSYILQKFRLLEFVREYQGRIVENDQFKRFEECLRTIADKSDKIERLFVDRIHMDLMLSISEEEFADKLTNDYRHFEENFQLMIRLLADKQQRSHLLSIALLSWLKYYTHIYAFALNNDWHLDIMSAIDRLLTNDETPFGATLKIFILKQLIHMNNRSSIEKCERFQRQILWLQPLLARLKQGKDNMREEIIMPTPLFDGRDEYLRVNAILNDIQDLNEVRTIINECAQNQHLMYSVYIWFIQYYCRFYSPEMQTDQSLLKLIQVDLKQLFSNIFQPIGFQLIVSLCTNFTPDSYFHLLPTRPKIELHLRLMALNMMVLCLSTRALPQSTQLGTLLFNNQRRMPESYIHHIQSVCLLGFIINDPVATQMNDVRTRVQERLNAGQIQRQGSFMFQCSQECRWIFHFEDCGVPNSRSRCPLCKKDIGAERYNVLIARNPPQIQLTIDQGFQIIDQYLDAFNRQVRLG